MLIPHKTACAQEDNFTLEAELLCPLTDIAYPIPLGVCCPWARLQPVTNLDLSLQFAHSPWGKIKKWKKNKPRKEYFICLVLDRA